MKCEEDDEKRFRGSDISGCLRASAKVRCGGVRRGAAGLWRGTHGRFSDFIFSILGVELR